ncbi:MAG: FeoC-like transcriptional regulator [Zoogloeaceae bacterium]|jgi:hypothetical protein|nr:FeoC-like transcriptional regulator [Zoogloeaceae bacterium]
MTPSALRAYLRHSGPASLSTLTAHFGADVDLLQDLLAYWRKKGRILENVRNCGKTCAQCAQGAVFYQWREQKTEGALCESGAMR